MKKIFKLKKWLSLGDAARRLSLICEEEITYKDIIQLCLDGELDVCWYFRYGWAREAAMYTSLIGVWFQDEKALVSKKDTGSLSIEDLMNEFLHGPKGTLLTIGSLSEPFRIEGTYKIVLDTGTFRDHLLSFLTGSESKLVNIEGCLIVDDDGRYLQPVEFLPNKDNEKVFERLAERAYPSDQLPELDELVLLREDLEKLEVKISNPNTNTNTNTKLRTPQETVVKNLALMALLLSETSAKYKKGETANASQIANDLEKLAARKAIELEKNSNFNRDISAAIKSLK